MLSHPARRLQCSAATTLLLRDKAAGSLSRTASSSVVRRRAALLITEQQQRAVSVLATTIAANAGFLTSQRRHYLSVAASSTSSLQHYSCLGFDSKRFYSAAMGPKYNYPKARRDETAVDTYHGVEVTSDFIKILGCDVVIFVGRVFVFFGLSLFGIYRSAIRTNGWRILIQRKQKHMLMLRMP